MATYDLTSQSPTKFKKGDIINCPYSGAVKSITLSKGTYKLECWGAQGGKTGQTNDKPYGGYSYGTLILKNNKTNIYIYAGGAGISGGGSAGGFNGGGSAAPNDGSSGGGGSDIRIDTDSLYARVIVAGGGGGFGGNTTVTYYGGVGGGISGGNGNGYSTTYAYGAKGATQTAGGSAGGNYKGSDGAFGQGGNAATQVSSYNKGAGGGGGWYGGGGSGGATSSTNATRYYGGAGGGSGYVYTSSTASNYPSGCLLNSSYYLEDASTVDGTTSFTDYDGSTVTGHSGDGACRITVLECGSGNLKVRVNEKKVVDTSTPHTEIAYLKTTGLEFFDTGVVPTQNTNIQIQFKATDIGDLTDGSGVCPYGAAVSWNSSAFECYTWSGMFQSNFGSSQVDIETAQANVKYKILTNTADNTLQLTNMDTGEITTVYRSSAEQTFTAPCNLYLCALHRYTTSDILTIGAPMYLYSAIILDGDTVLRNYIPVKKDDIVCLYDQQNDTYLYNGSSSGNTLEGPSEEEETGWKDVKNIWLKINETKWAKLEE